MKLHNLILIGGGLLLLPRLLKAAGAELSSPIQKSPASQIGNQSPATQSGNIPITLPKPEVPFSIQTLMREPGFERQIPFIKELQGVFVSTPKVTFEDPSLVRVTPTGTTESHLRFVQPQTAQEREQARLANLYNIYLQSGDPAVAERLRFAGII
jgi:hypothetical protein